MDLHFTKQEIEASQRGTIPDSWPRDITLVEALERAKTPKFKYADSYRPDDVRCVLDDTIVMEAEIERLRNIISGAFAHSYGPYSHKELLRRVVAILKTINAKDEMKPAAPKPKED